MAMYKRNKELSFGYILNMFSCLIFYSHSSMLVFSLFDEFYQDKVKPSRPRGFYTLIVGAEYRLLAASCYRSQTFDYAQASG